SRRPAEDPTGRAAKPAGPTGPAQAPGPAATDRAVPRTRATGDLAAAGAPTRNQHPPETSTHVKPPPARGAQPNTDPPRASGTTASGFPRPVDDASSCGRPVARPAPAWLA